MIESAALLVGLLTIAIIWDSRQPQRVRIRKRAARRDVIRRD